MAKQREEDAVFVGFESNLPERVHRERKDESLGPPPVDPDLVAAALADAEAAEAKSQEAPPAEAVDEDEFDDEESEGKPWLKWVIIAVVVAVIGYFAYRQMQDTPEPAPTEASSQPAQPKEVEQGEAPAPSPAETPPANDQEEAP